MENYPNINKRFKSANDEWTVLCKERYENVKTQIQNFVNSFEKIGKLPKDKHILTNFNSIQYQKFSMKRLNFDKNSFTEQMMMNKSSNPENNIFVLKKNGFSYNDAYPLFQENVPTFEVKNIIINNNLKNNISTIKINNLKRRNDNKMQFKNQENDKIDDNQDKGIKIEISNTIIKKEETNNNLGSNNNILNDNNSNIKYKPIFIINNEVCSVHKRSTKKGRRALKISQRIHSASDDDNILRKVQVHFLSFIINFMNDIVRTFLPCSYKQLIFRNIDYDIKKVVNHDAIRNLKTKTILDILKFNVSRKNKRCSKVINLINAGKICEKLDFMDEFLKQNYLNFFNDYYYSSSNKNFIVNGKPIKVTEKTKIFSDLLRKNYSYQDRIKKVVIDYFMNDFKGKKTPNFETKKIENDI